MMRRSLFCFLALGLLHCGDGDDPGNDSGSAGGQAAAGQNSGGKSAGGQGSTAGRAGSAGGSAGKGGGTAAGSGGASGGAQGGSGGSGQAGSGSTGQGSASSQAGSSGKGGSSAGQGGSAAGGGGGSSSSGASGSAGSGGSSGASGSAQAGSGGSPSAGNGGSPQAGSGGSPQAGSGGSAQAGSGGSAQAGSGGSAQAGSGGSTAGKGGGSGQGGSGQGGSGGGSGSGGEICEVDGKERVGEATYYVEANGSGNCSFPATPNDLMVGAMNHTDYDGSAACGACASIDGPSGPVVVRIVDRCPECKPGDIDLSPLAFGKLAALEKGRIPIAWRYVACPVQGALVYHFKDGSNPWWTAVQIRNHRYPVAKVEYKAKDGSFKAVERLEYNYFVEPAGMGPGPYTFRVTDVLGHVVEDSGVALKDDGDVASKSQFPVCGSP